MRGFLFSACCWAIGLWTLATAGSSFWYLREIAALQAEWARAFGLPAGEGVGLVVLWLTIQISAWAIVVVPLALIAILARPAWPVASAAASGVEVPAAHDVRRTEPTISRPTST